MSTATAARRKCGPGHGRVHWGMGRERLLWFCDPLGGGTRAGESSPFRAERAVDTGPPLGARSLVAATCCVVVRQGRGHFPVARRLSEAVSGYSDQRRGHR